MINLNRLPNQQRDETCELFLRRHWLEVVKIILITLGFLALLVALYIVFRGIGDSLGGLSIGPLLALLSSAYLFVVAIIFMNQFTDYYLDTWIVTSERIINIEQIGLFNRVISELHLNQIQDITAETKGFLNTLLTYGDVFTQTAGARQRFIFKDIDDPDVVKEKILRLVQVNKRRRGDASVPISVSDALTEPPDSDSVAMQVL